MATTGMRTLAIALGMGLGMMAGVDIGAEDRRTYRPSPDRYRVGSKMQQRKSVLREKRRAKNKMARKSRAKGR